jgi:hypothetical protein
LRSLRDAAEFEFGSDSQRQTDAGHITVRAAFAAAAIFWNELAFLRGIDDEGFLREPCLIEMRRVLAAELKRMSETPAHEDTHRSGTVFSLFDPDSIQHSRYGDYVRNTGDHFQELVSLTPDLNTSHTVELSGHNVEQAFKGARSELKL